MKDNLGNTWMSEWNLVCENEYLKNVAEMFFLVGVATGGIISGYLSDKFGRRTMLFWSVIFQTIFGMISAFILWHKIQFSFQLKCFPFTAKMNQKKRFGTVHSVVISSAFGVTWFAGIGVGVCYICRSHIGHWVCRWKMANNRWNVQFISIARFIHAHLWDRLHYSRLPKFTALHIHSGHISLLFMVSQFSIVKL